MRLLCRPMTVAVHILSPLLLLASVVSWFMIVQRFLYFRGADAEMLDQAREQNLASLRAVLPAPYLGLVPHLESPTPECVAAVLGACR